MVNLLKIFIPTCFLFVLCYSQQVVASFTEFENFGANPGELTASYSTVESMGGNMVVLLHGCVQNGQELAQQSGLASLAKTRNFTLLIPQQNSKNNIKNCFNWFSAQDTAKDSGELLSIKNMIISLKNKIQAENIYILGISAGGAMTAVMLANYPEVFSGGAVIAGIPFPCADNLIKAISCMRSGPSDSPEELSNKVFTLHAQQKNWPRLSVWTGMDDKIVSSVNAQYLALQWAHLTQISLSPIITKAKGYQRTQWHNQDQQITLELVQIEGVDHGMSVNPDIENGGMEGPFLLKSPLSAAVSIIEFWQLDE